MQHNHFHAKCTISPRRDRANSHPGRLATHPHPSSPPSAGLAWDAACGAVPGELRQQPDHRAAVDLLATVKADGPTLAGKLRRILKGRCSVAGAAHQRWRAQRCGTRTRSWTQWAATARTRRRDLMMSTCDLGVANRCGVRVLLHVCLIASGRDDRQTGKGALPAPRLCPRPRSWVREWSATTNLKGAPPVSAQPHGWGFSVSRSGELHQQLEGSTQEPTVVSARRRLGKG
jgi:hypothetical protein